MMSPRALRGRLVLALAVLLVAACRPAPAATPLPPTPAPRSPVTAAVTVTPVLTPTLTPAPAAPSPTGTPDAYQNWEAIETDELSIRLPPGWQALELSQEDAGSLYERLKLQQPFLAGVAGDPETLQEATLVAAGPEREGPAETLTIRYSLLGAERITDLRGQVVDLIVPQYEKLGFAPETGEAGLRTGEGLALDSIRYEVGGDAAPEIRAQQFFVATGDELWILTFTFAAKGEHDPEHFRLAAISFAPR